MAQTKNSNKTNLKSKNYVFVQRDGDDFTSLKITEGKYKDIIFNFGNVGFAKEENEHGELPMHFDYNVVSNPSNLNIDNQDFIDYIGDILHELLVEKYGK